jgi:subtilisin family serine protease
LLLVLSQITAVRAAPQPVAVSDVRLGVSPPSISMVVQPGGRAVTTLHISNPADVPITPLLFSTLPEDLRPAAARKPAGPERVPLPSQPTRLDPQLLRRDASGSMVDFTLYLAEQADLSPAYAMRDWRARGWYVYQTLSQHAERTQRGLRNELQARGLPYRPLWIVNAIRVQGRPADALALSQRAEVALVRAEHSTALAPDPAPVPLDAGNAVAQACDPDNSNEAVCWNIRMIGAERVWRDFGVTGRGIVVAGNDSGVAFQHPALLTRYRGYRAPGLFEHAYNWYDPQYAYDAPHDASGHGTHTLSTMVATSDGSSAQPAVGVAPGASWIAAQGCDGQFCSESDLILAAQWLLAPTDRDDRNPRPDLRPMIINNSWAGPGGSDWYAGYTAAWRAAGIFPVFAAGNSPANTLPACGSIASPADYGDVAAVGALDHRGQIAAFSLLGPTVAGLVKPDLAAPGTYASGQMGVLGASNAAGASYKTLQGTSMAAPHVAGVVALLWSANPTLIGDFDATMDVLRRTAQGHADVRCGDGLAVPNNIYGSGRVDAYAAVARVRRDVPWLSLGPAPTLEPGAAIDVQLAADSRSLPGPGAYRAELQLYAGDLAQTPVSVPVLLTVLDDGSATTVSGFLRDAISGTPISGRVSVDGGSPLEVGEQGFTLRLRPGAYTLSASASGYRPRTVSLDVGQATLAFDITLERAEPVLTVLTERIEYAPALGERTQASVTVRNTGSAPLLIQTSVPPDVFSIWRSDQPGGPQYAWRDLPPDAPHVELARGGRRAEIPIGFAFPFYGHTLTETVVAANGMLSFVEPFGGVPTPSRCLPDAELVFYTIAPFRSDIDPELGGQIRYGLLGDAFVVSYEGVALAGAAGTTYTFQTLLHRDGRIMFQYRDLGPLPSQLAVGVQHTPNHIQQIGCGVTTPVHAGLAIELRPQPSPQFWLAGPAAQAQIEPGEVRQLSLELSWARPQGAPLRGTLRIASNDPWHPTWDVPVTLAPRPASSELWLVVAATAAAGADIDAIIPP